MNTNQILSADMLDLVFADRNKEYGAYELRRTYQKRITKAMIFTGCITVLAFGTVLATTKKLDERPKAFVHDEVTITEIKPDEPKPLPEPVRQPEPEPVRRLQFSTPIIVAEPDTPPPTVEDLNTAIADIVNVDGRDYVGEPVQPDVIDVGKGIIETNNVPDEPFREVAVEAKFKGNWGRFLEKNLRGEVPIENGAPVGRHRVVIQFVVSLDGTISDIIPLTKVGYGMEEEAIRVIKKATNWEPAMQNGHFVKAYRTQPIIFEVTEQ